MAMSILKNKIKMNSQYQQQLKRLRRENPNPGRAQSLCEGKVPAAEVPERNTVALTSHLKIYHSSSFKTKYATYAIYVHFLFENRPMIDVRIGAVDP